MYAILQHGGHQYRVSPGDRLTVDRLDSEIGAVVTLEGVVFAHDDKAASVGASAGKLRIAATVLAHPRGPKIRVYKYKAKKRYRRTMGHRSDITELLVEAILAPGEAAPKPKPVVARDDKKAVAPAKSAPKAETGKSAKPVAKVAEVAEVEKPKTMEKTAEKTPEKAPVRKPAAAKSDSVKAEAEIEVVAPDADGDAAKGTDDGA